MVNNRILAPHQHLLEILNRRASTWNMTVFSRIRGFLSEETLRQALEVAQYRHPYLNCRIVGDLDRLRFETEGTQKIPLRVVERIHEKHWQEIVLSELNEKIDSSRYLMRAVLVRDEGDNGISHLITTVHHAIADGLSFLQLQSEILTYCCQKNFGELLNQVAQLAALPPLEELMPKPAKASLENQTKIAEIDHLTVEKLVSIKSRCSGWFYRQLNEGLIQKLEKMARQEKTTVNGALCAAMLLAIAKIIRQTKRTDSLRLSCESSINLRPYLEPAVSNEHLSWLISLVYSRHVIETNTAFWDLAREVRQQIKEGLPHSVQFNLAEFDRELAQKILVSPNELGITVEITNMGKLNIPTAYGALELEEISLIFGQAGFAGVPALAVTTFRKKAILNFLFSEPSISRETMEILADSVVYYLHEACGEEVHTGLREMAI
ncbi:phthiocerol/phthiodiolone dimycocerosyl transferase family protein [Microcoleus sp. F4-D5]|uniref:phthiocerol/phthiodiolone dimycocerosyl transferase family protein n=1 Tax=Microcoleus sp. F4-D5 TaxID=2818760 RepID=UPI002FD1103E